MSTDTSIVDVTTSTLSDPERDLNTINGNNIYADYENLDLSSGEGWFVWEADYPSEGYLGPYETKVDAMIAARINDITLVPKKKGI